MNTIVIKYGGSLLEEPGHRSAFLKDIAALDRKGSKVILVHGGGKEISRQMEKAGLQPRFVNGRRYTDEATMTVVQQALSGLNAEIVAELERCGAPAVGLSGQDRHLVKAMAVAELGRVGLPTSVDTVAFKDLLGRRVLPVFYSVAEDAQDQPLNINADDFALALAIACRADRLIFLTDTGGILDLSKNRIPVVTPQEVDALAAQQVITGGMLVKAKACVEALQKGVGSVDIVKGIGHLLDPTRAEPEGTTFTHGR